VEVRLHAFLISEICGCEWSASHSGCFITRKRAAYTHIIIIIIIIIIIAETKEKWEG